MKKNTPMANKRPESLASFLSKGLKGAVNGSGDPNQTLFLKAINAVQHALAIRVIRPIQINMGVQVRSHFSKQSNS